MNGFRLIGDGTHFVGVLVLLFKIFFTKSSATGVSWKSLFLYTATYCARYLDLYSNFISVYNSSLKIFFIITASVPMIIIPWVLKNDYQKKFDTFWIELLILPVTALSLVIKHDNTMLEICWTWSIYMEAVAMIPQFYMTWRGGHIDVYLLTYVTSMVSYRGLYIANWAYRFYEEHYYDLISIGGGVTETVIGLVGLVMTLVLYRLRFHESTPGRSYYAYTLPSSNHGIYTLPFVTSAHDEKIGSGVKPMSLSYDNQGLVDSDTQSLLKLLEEDPQNAVGPYNHSLSVPIIQRGFIA